MVEPAKDELRLLPHVGAKVADAMREAGLYTIEDVASASVDTLSAVPGLGRKRAATVKQAAMDLLDDRNEEEPFKAGRRPVSYLLCIGIGVIIGLAIALPLLVAFNRIWETL